MSSREDGSAGEFFTGEIGKCRPLPPHPDVEFEKKRAKRLLKEARTGDAGALRTMALVAAGVPPEELQLELAQLAVAREYGFSSWVRLTQYYQRWNVLLHGSHRQRHGHSFFVNQTGWFKNGQAQRIAFYGQIIASQLPRLYGKSNDEVFASPITDDEARFIVARQHGCATWEELQTHARPDILGKTVEERRRELEPEEEALRKTPEAAAYRAIRAHNTEELGRIVDANPWMLQEFDSVYGGRTSLIRSALMEERRDEGEATRQITDWFVARGALLQPVLDGMLRYPGNRGVDDIEYWIRRGANPDSVARTGYSTLEYALVRYNVSMPQPEMVAALLRHVKRIPDAMWVAAGLGEVRKTLAFFGADGRLAASARARRPDFAAFAMGGGPFHPDADDETIIFEAMLVAVLNERVDVLRAVLDRGFAVDASPHNRTLLMASVECAAPRACEFLLSRGADPDAPQLWNTSPRHLAMEIPKSMAPDTPESYLTPRRRIGELLASAPKRS
jgi:hypothetical protein